MKKKGTDLYGGVTMATCGVSPQFASQFISEFRIVLLGNRGSGKTSLANTILCRPIPSPKSTAKCMKVRGVAGGRLVTIIDTPGWWKNFLVSESAAFLKQELVLSMAHCAPGPHAVLLVIRVDTAYKERHRRSAVEHLELLGKDIWNHMMVVFTYGDHFKDQTVGERIRSEGESFLQWLVNKCGNRYHVLNIDRCSGSQVKELLEMIEDMVTENGGCYYEVNRKCLTEVKEMRRVMEEEADKKRMMMQKQKEICEGHSSLSTLRMVLLGYRRSGKTSVRNNIFGNENSDCKRTTQCGKTQSEVAGKLITVLDTPGWWKTLSTRDTPDLDKLEILRSASLCPPGPHAFLLTLRLDMPFTEVERKSTEEHMDLLGERVWNHTIFLFTHADLLGDVTVEQYIESEGKDLRLLVAKCRNRYYILNNKNLVDGSQVTGLFEKVEEMVAENEGLHYEMDQRTNKEVTRRWRLVEKRSKMKLKVKKRGEMAGSTKGAGHHLSELSIILLGYGEAGKTSTSNTILDSEESGSGRTTQCVKRYREVAGRLLTVVDTPGWWKHLTMEHTPQLNKQEIAKSIFMTSGPVMFLLVLRLDSSFKEEEKRAVEDHMKLFGCSVWDQTLVLFTCGDWLGDRRIELYIESEGEALKWLLEKCGNRYHVLNNKKHHSNTQVCDLLEKIQQLVVENGASGSGGRWSLKKTKKKLEKGQAKKGGMQNQNDFDSDDDDVFIIDMEANT
ncbi:GTPase IMAP family member 8 [Trichomycterus rosablanca]|uniref:GTPase IMAP family member 8 n=1 Tax=Trichomycterus rosablanca TaxID=2290929 RepID=UPI002F35D986